MRRRLLLAALVLTALALVACSGSDDATSSPSAGTPTAGPGPTPTALQPSTPTPFPTITPSVGRPTGAPTPFPTIAPPPTPTPTPRPRPTPTPPALTESYENDSLGYSLGYPVGWEVSADGPLTTIAHPIGTNVLVTGEVRGSVTLDEHVERALGDYTRGAMGAGIENFRETSRSLIESPSSYLVQGEGSVEGVTFLTTMLFTVNESSALFAVGTVRESLEDLHQPILDAMFDSFTTFSRQGPPVDDHSDNPARATEIGVGETATGVIGEAEDDDYFRYQALADTTYRIDVDLRTLGDSILVLSSDGGDCLITLNDDRDDGLASSIQWTVGADDELHLLVTNADGRSTGSYSLTVDIAADDSRTDEHGNAPCSSTAVSVGVPVTGTIDDARDTDWFGFEAEEGDTYTLEVTLGTLADSLMGMYDPVADEFPEINDDFGESLASRIVWMAPRTGMFFVDVENPDLQSLGTYTLSITPGGEVEPTPTPAVEEETPAPTPTPAA